MTKQTVWCNANYAAEYVDKLRQGLGQHQLILPTKVAATNLVAGEPDPTLERATIAFGQPDPQQVISLPNLKWLHLNSAGYTRYDTPEFKNAMRSRGTVVTNASGVYDEPCAQHLLAMMLGFSRQLPECRIDQFTDRSWVYKQTRYETFLLQGQTILIYGFGAIGRRLVEMLAPFRMNLIAVKRNPTPHEGVKVVTPSEADALLHTADHVINALPASAETENYFHLDRFKLFKHGTHFYNIGRGTTVDQIGLMAELETQRIRGAYLDVTSPEPLPSDSPLWTAPNCHITPHIGGGHVNEFDRVIAHFLDNFERFTAGKSLNDRIV